MKKILLTLCMALVAVGASARYISEPSMQGEKAIAAHYLIATKTPNMGLGIRYQQFVVDHVRVEGMFEYLFKHKELSMWSCNFNGHYVWNLGSSFRIYPLAGICFGSWKEHVTDDKDFRVGLNVGAGLQVKLMDNLWLGAEARLQEMRHYGQGVFDVNIAYCF